ncbi:HipA domain-containing protein [Undibacterium amnicola]|uniref:HipA domain-containing protein n=1 Tax=Undibacterium amnicola TaxID=1834038 RepID=A0ABR6XQR2_9BURK|nr:HipA domain-containing protein [Undibacterium amnicola]MBC3831820.1 HipA domain-containing protein [Undibacterium amnicola]
MTSRSYQFAGRTFYEVDRIDRHGEFGRFCVCSLHELNAALFGGTGNWSDGADAPSHVNYISEETAPQIKLLAHFGRMISNTDMHDGNLAFLLDMRLAPAYDMLPMMYAPQRGAELIERKLNPALPLPNERESWMRAAKAAVVFLRRVEGDERISSAFRQIAKGNAELSDRLVIGQGR